MKFGPNSAILEGAYGVMKAGDSYLPLEFTGARDEFMASRETASLGVFLNILPAFDISGPDAVKFLNSVCVNRDFAQLKIGKSRHGLICNDRGQMLASGVILRTSEETFRTYGLAPAIHYHQISSGMNLQGNYFDDEYFFQIDGPKSLEILENATESDLHDLKFGQNKIVQICGTDMVVYRLGMSGALAYEVHGAAKDAEIAYARLRDSLFKFGGKRQGIRNYSIINHTPGGYPNQMANFMFPYTTSGEGLKAFVQGKMPNSPFIGSASDNFENQFANPFEVGWGKLVNFDHDFPGKEALQQLAQNPPRCPVTLEWNADDVGEVFTSQFRGKDVEPYEQLEYPTNFSSVTQSLYFAGFRADHVLLNGKRIGISSGRTYAFYEQRMISLATIDAEHSIEGLEVTILWGSPGKPQKEIRAKVARFPYYNGEFRNETYDVGGIPRLKK